MSIQFNYTRRDNGAKVAKVNVTFDIERGDLVRAALTVGCEWLEDNYGYRDLEDYLTYEQVPRAFERLSRAAIERELRSRLLSYGDIWQQSSDSENGDAYMLQMWDAESTGLLAACREAAEATVDRLFPEALS